MTAIGFPPTGHRSFAPYPFQEFDFTLDRHRKKKTSIVRISEYLPRLDPKGRLFYNEYVRKYKIERGIEGGVIGDDDLFHGLTLMRPASLPDVSDKEKFIFGLILPHIQTAISNAVRFTELKISAFLPEDFCGWEKPGFIIVNEKGAVSFYNPKAEEYCRKYFHSCSSNIQRLAPEIRGLFDRFILFLSRENIVPAMRASRSFVKKIHGDQLRMDIALLPDADRLFISEKTVKRHLSTIYAKLRCKGRYALMAYFNRARDIEL